MEKRTAKKNRRDWMEGKKIEGSRKKERKRERAGQAKDKIKLKTWFVRLCSPALFSGE